MKPGCSALSTSDAPISFVDIAEVSRVHLLHTSTETTASPSKIMRSIYSILIKGNVTEWRDGKFNKVKDVFFHQNFTQVRVKSRLL